MQKGKLIVIDGADGAGKATQVALLTDRLRAEKVPVEALDFPRYTDNTFGALIRECLDGKRGDFMSVDSRIASVLYAADRFETRPMIEKWLGEGTHVILDRYVSANMMHQGSKIDDEKDAEDFLEWLDTMEHTVFGLPRPDVILYLDVPHEVSQKLMRSDSSRANIDVAEADVEHQKRSKERAKTIVAATQGWYAVDCTADGSLRTREDIHKDIYNKVRDLLI